MKKATQWLFFVSLIAFQIPRHIAGVSNAEGSGDEVPIVCSGEDCSYDVPIDVPSTHKTTTLPIRTLPNTTPSTVCNPEIEHECVVEFGEGSGNAYAECIPKKQICNGIKDCLDGSDEHQSICDDKTTTVTEETTFAPTKLIPILGRPTETTHFKSKPTVKVETSLPTTTTMSTTTAKIVAAVNCEWHEWQNGTCSKSCGGGIRMNIRTKKVAAENGGEECSGSSNVTERCNIGACPYACELKDRYLPGYLPNNILKNFKKASDAYVACKQELNCTGLTYEAMDDAGAIAPGKWTLRSSSSPRISTRNGVSMLLECLNIYGFLPRYTIEGRSHCYDAKSEEQFSKFADAKKNCNEDKNCFAIWDSQCEGKRFYTCRATKDWKEPQFSRTS